MGDIINTNINDSSGSWGSSDTIEYETESLSNLQSDLSAAMNYLDEIGVQIDRLEAFDTTWEGKAKETYIDLKTILKQYRADYTASVRGLKASVDGLASLISDIPSANVIKEIDNA